MRQTYRKFYIRMVALVAALLLLLPAIPAARAASGTCGDGVNWELAQGVLTISGNGDMTNYSEESPAPWNGLDVLAVRVEKGVRSVGNLAFFRMESVTSVVLADSVQSVGRYAFYGCAGLTMLDLGKGLETIGQSAFEQCTSLMSLRLPESLRSIGEQAFYCCEALQTVTVPSSVTYMGAATFAHCTALGSAYVNAKIEQLPVWSFYGCSALQSVVLNPVIEETGVEAFEGCDMSRPPVRENITVTGSVTHSSVTQDKDGNTVEHEYVDSGNSAISKETSSAGTTTVDAVLENSSGWAELGEQLQNNTGTAQVQVQLKGDTTMSLEDLEQFIGKDVQLQIQTSQGAQWNINGKDLQVNALRQEKYDLSYTIKRLTDLSSDQKLIIGTGTAFAVVFDGSVDFKTEVVLPLGVEWQRNVAHFIVETDVGYTSLQQVLVDDEGKAHFFLQQVQGGVEYLVGVGIQTAEEEKPLVPEPMKSEYGVDQEEEVKYIVTGVKSSWGMDIKQVTWILFGIMGGSILVVGIVIGTMNKVKLKKGYVPDLDEEEPMPRPRSKRKK